MLENEVIDLEKKPRRGWCRIPNRSWQDWIRWLCQCVCFRIKPARLCLWDGICYCQWPLYIIGSCLWLVKCLILAAFVPPFVIIALLQVLVLLILGLVFLILYVIYLVIRWIIIQLSMLYWRVWCYSYYKTQTSTQRTFDDFWNRKTAREARWDLILSLLEKERQKKYKGWRKYWLVRTWQKSMKRCRGKKTTGTGKSINEISKGEVENLKLQ